MSVPGPSERELEKYRQLIGTGAIGVTVVGDTTFVLIERAKAVAVPYPPK